MYSFSTLINLNSVSGQTCCNTHDFVEKKK
jgi:hypothetical protein